MQEMKKRRIVLASLLKPVNDTRMFEKMGVSLVHTGLYEVHIIGSPSAADLHTQDIHFHPLPRFERLSAGRIAARIKVLRKVIKLKPELLIVNTHELLGVAILIRILFGAIIVYDIQENYWKNILSTSAFPKLFRPVIAFFVRLKEWVASPLFSQFLLAEKCYADELGFIGKRYLIIENKCKVPGDFRRTPQPDFIQLVFTGTLAESTGVFGAIRLAEQLHKHEPKIRLTIVGYCAQPNVLRRIEKEVSQRAFISLIGGSEMVPHDTIMRTIAAANFGIVCYPMSPHIENKMPTKVYEYLACQLPVLLQNHPPWAKMCAPCPAAIVIDFDQTDAKAILEKIRISHFYSQAPQGVTWEGEEEKLKSAIRHVLTA